MATPTSQATTKSTPLVVPSFYKPSLSKFKKKNIMRKRGVLQLASQPGSSQCPCVHHRKLDKNKKTLKQYKVDIFFHVQINDVFVLTFCSTSI
jgi:hypothetical protein